MSDAPDKEIVDITDVTELPAVPRTFTPSQTGDLNDERLMVGIMRAMKQEMLAEFALNREWRQRVLERLDAIAIDIDTLFKQQRRTGGRK